MRQDSPPDLRRAARPVRLWSIAGSCWRAIARFSERTMRVGRGSNPHGGVTVERGVTTMRGQLGTLLPRQAGRQRSGNRAAALHYAAWDWPITPNAALPCEVNMVALPTRSPRLVSM